MLIQKGVMNNRVDVSVVIPAYNAEKYLPECIDSLLAQSLSSIEIIVVDDGSIDQTKEIVLEYQRRDPRVKLIQQDREGAGAARNRGMTYAEGKYIVFLDADDFFEPVFLMSVYTIAEENSVQIVLFNYFEYNNLNGKKTKMITKNCPVGVVSSRDLGNRLFQVGRMTPWNKCFLKSFLDENDLKFQNIKKSNDVLFSICSLSLAQRMIFLDNCFVYYRTENPTSLQGNVNTNPECGIMSRVAAKQELIKRGLYEGTIKESFYHCCKDLVLYLKTISDADVLGSYYLFLKENLVPNLFDSYHNFEDEKILSALYDSKNYEDFLFRLYRLYKANVQHGKHNNVSKDCLEYRLGYSILRFPRRLKHGMERFFNVHRD